jgi:hypothetical protein
MSSWRWTDLNVYDKIYMEDETAGIGQIDFRIGNSSGMAS